MPVFIWPGGVRVNYYWKRRCRLHPAGTPVTIAERGEYERRRLSGHARQGQQDTGQNTTRSGRQHDRRDHPPLVRAQRERSLAQRTRHVSQKTFRVPQYRWDDHDPQCESAGQGRKMMHGYNDQSVCENTDHDRWHAVQQVRRVPHQKRDRPPAEFRQVHAAEQTDRNPNERRQEQQLQAAQDGIGHSTTEFAHRSGKPREKIPGKVFSAVPHEIAKNKKKGRHREQCAKPREREHRHVQRLSPDQAGAHVGSTPLPRAVVTRIRSRARPFRTNVSRNRTRPSSIRALRYKLPVASENSFASTAAIEYPGENKDAAILGLLPTTMVTAIVSPSARASARNTDPKMPIRAAGTTTFQVDSHFVAPRARAASLRSRATGSRSSQDTDKTSGTIMIARTIPVVRNPMQYAGP